MGAGAPVWDVHVCVCVSIEALLSTPAALHTRTPTTLHTPTHTPTHSRPPREGGFYPLTMEFTEDYPAKPPKVSAGAGWSPMPTLPRLVWEK